MKIYLAGKVDERKWRLVRPFKHLCEFISSEGSDASHGPHGWKVGWIIGAECWNQCNDDGGKEFSERLVIDKIRQSDALIAYLYTGDSFGSIAEIAFASALGKSCHVIIDERPSALEALWGNSPLRDAYWFVCTFPRVRVYHAQSDAEAHDRFVEILEHLGLDCIAKVYFIEAIGKNEIKIGSGRNADRRLRLLQTGNGSDLRLLGTMPGGRTFEHELHRRFHHLRIRPNGEWFSGEEELRNYISENATMGA